MLENGDTLELEMLDELTISVDELEDDASEEERGEDKIELLEDEELSELDDEVESNEQDDVLEKSELLSNPIEDEELVVDVIEELLHTSTVLQTSTS